MRRLVIFIAATALVNIIIASQLSYSAVRYMETPNFCGTTCHVMRPEFAAYQVAAHSKVECASCPRGIGASSFVRSKLNGVRQVVHLAFNSYPRPIPPPLEKLRPATETCESCHARRRFFGDRMRDLASFGSDEQNTLTHTVLMMHLGTGGPHSSGVHGAHLGEGVTLRYYAADDVRQNIPVRGVHRGRQDDGLCRARSQAGTGGDFAPCSVLTAIIARRTPSSFLNEPWTVPCPFGDISPALPFAKKQGLEILKQTYATGEDAAAKIPAAFEDFFRKSYPQIYAQLHDDVVRSAGALLGVYQRNVFPEMKITWGTYPTTWDTRTLPGASAAMTSSMQAPMVRRLPRIAAHAITLWRPMRKIPRP